MSATFAVILKDHLRPAGGPSGYLYNLQESLETNKIEQIHLLTLGAPTKKKSAKKKPFKAFIKSLKVKFLPVSIRQRHIRHKEQLSYEAFFASIEKALEASSIYHFHHTKDLYYFKKLYPQDDTTTLLMSHAPEPPYIELAKAYQGDGYSEKEAAQLASPQKEMDILAFRSADHIVFPCEEAVSPYTAFFKEHDIDTHRLRYVLTASKPLRYMLERSTFRERYDIPEQKLLFAYIGRRTHIKGYDIFCEAARALERDERFMFIAAGSGAIASPDTKNFIDMGWTDDPGSILNAADYLVVPNRDTYFDLGIIQAFSLNTALITTATGGNRWFLDKELDIRFIEPDPQGLVESLETLERTTSKRNIDFFKSHLDNAHLAPNYLTMFQAILREHSAIEREELTQSDPRA